MLLQKNKENMYFRIIILSTFILININLYGQTHFTTVDTTGLPYILVITNIILNGEGVSESTEVGVFDDTLCVGVALFNGTYNLQVTTWEGNFPYELPGFTPGDTMKFIIWTQINNQWQEIEMHPEFEVGNGTFGYGSHSVLSLNTTIVNCEETSDIIINYRLLTYPNPFNSTINFIINVLEPTNYQLKIFSLSGKEIFGKRGYFQFPGKYSFAWNGKSNSGKGISSGIYLTVLNIKKFHTISKITYLK